MKKSMKQLLALIMAMSLSLSLLSANVWASDKADRNFMSAQSSCEGITTDAASAEGQLFWTGKPEEKDVVKSESTAFQEQGYDLEGLLGSTLVKKPSSTTEDTSSVDEDTSQKEKDSEAAQRILQVMDDDYEDTNESGKCGERLTWEYNRLTGVLTIRGSGTMNNWDRSDDVPWAYFRDDIVSVVIQSGVESIGECAFWGCEKLSRVTIPNTVTSIGFIAFGDCRSLTSVTLPNHITNIESDVFSGCIGLTRVSIPNSVTSIGESSFAACYSLISVVIPDSVTSIGYEAFMDCSSL